MRPDPMNRFTGHERDTETGLDYMKARYYGASMGRFGAADSMIDTNEHVINSWNRYLYTNNNPISYLDVDGKLRLSALQNFNQGNYHYDISFYSIKDNSAVHWLRTSKARQFVTRKAVSKTEAVIPELKVAHKALTAVHEFNNLVIGKEVELNIDPLKKNIPSFDQKKFERSVEKRFIDLVNEDMKKEHGPTDDPHQYPATVDSAGEHKYTEKGMDLLQQSVNDTVDAMVKDGKLTKEQGDLVKALYDISVLSEQAQKAAKDHYTPTQAEPK